MATAFKLYEEGDKVAARTIARHVLQSQPTEVERAQAEDLLARLRPPRLGYLFAAIVAVCALLLALLARHLLE